MQSHLLARYIAFILAIKSFRVTSAFILLRVRDCMPARYTLRPRYLFDTNLYSIKTVKHVGTLPMPHDRLELSYTKDPGKIALHLHKWERETCTRGVGKDCDDR